MLVGKLWKTIAGGFALLACTLGIAAPAAARGPALWKVADADTTIYLFGTIHSLPTGTDWRSKPIADAIAGSDTLVLELVLGDPAESGQLITQLGVSPGQPPLAERVPAGRHDALTRLIGASGYPPPFLDQMESWAAAVALAGVAFSQAGFTSDQGIETQLTGIYRQAQKPILGLETTQQQLGFLDSLPEEAQRALLIGTIEDPAAMKAQLQSMLDAWIGGDVEAIAATFDKETQLSASLRETLVLKRNQAWSAWIGERMARPGKIFLAVGAGHLAGADSLQKMLAERGLKAERIN